MRTIQDSDCPKDTLYMVNPHFIVTGTALWDERRRFWWKPWTWFRKNVEGMPGVVQTKRFTEDQIEAKWGRLPRPPRHP